MALGKRVNGGILGLGFVRSTSFGKRVYLSNDMEFDSTVTTPTKKHCSQKSFQRYEQSLLEALPQDILIRILCAVDHEDLKSLFQVSKLIRDAALIAKRLHFEYSTPRKTVFFRDSMNLEELNEFNEIEAPNAPKQSRMPRSRLNRKKLADIAVALFASPEMDMETEM